MDKATEHKHRLEECQRGEERQRAADNKPWKPRYFTKEVKTVNLTCSFSPVVQTVSKIHFI